jgi:hypothetical protein
LRFRGDGDYTVRLTLDDLTLSNNRETIVAATNCAADSVARARLERDRRGPFDGWHLRGAGGRRGIELPPAAVRPARAPRHPLREERPFLVAAGKPGVGWQLWVGMFTGIGLLVLAFPALGRFRAGSLRPR